MPRPGQNTYYSGPISMQRAMEVSYSLCSGKVLFMLTRSGADAIAPAVNTLQSLLDAPTPDTQSNLLELTPSIEMITETEVVSLPQRTGRIMVTDVDKEDEPERGRALERGPRISDPLARAESRFRLSNATLDVDTQAIRRRVSRSSTFHDDPSARPAILDDNLLEPCPHEPLCQTLSEVLNSPISSESFSASISRSNSDFIIRQASLVPPISLYAKVNGCGASSTPEPGKVAENETSNNPQPVCHDDSDSGSDSISPPQPSKQPEARMSKSCQSAYHDDSDKNVLLSPTSSYSVSTGGGPECPITPPTVASSLPTEILHQIYYNLSPPDFHAARHTCRTWFIGSLERNLLETMIRRGGYFSSILHDITANYVVDNGAKSNDEWLISKRLARECALGPAWTGNGLSFDDLSQVNGLSPFNGLSSLDDDLDGNSRARTFHEISTIDFTEVALRYQGIDSVGTVFTVSNCGKFLMAANGCMVYIYELNRSTTAGETHYPNSPGALRPVTGIICPHRVLACSMDTSSKRYAIAILLEGRMGLVCDVTALNRPPGRAARDSTKRCDQSDSSSVRGKDALCSEGLQGTSFLDRISLNSSVSVFNGGVPPREPPFIFPGTATSGSTFAPPDESEWLDVCQCEVPHTSQTSSPSSPHPSLPRASKLQQSSRLKSILPPHEDPELGVNRMPIETGPRSLYRNLCSDDDPPRSVAICPQRRCVAFGCSSGIELHWVDALTGQDLNRWFPLTAPSDYLFFLPPRRSIDSAKKLRLISSAARPSEQPALAERAFGKRHRNSILWEKLGRTTSVGGNSQSAWNRQPFATRISGNGSAGRAGFGRTELSDHYRAMPLSDGYHILFTDPITGLLCLGSDAPIGGPTKLLRKIWFQGPDNLGSPIVYASGSDLKWGVRVVAVFGSEQDQNVWLFSVPNDIFTADQSPIQSGQPLCNSRQSSKQEQNWDWLDWWPQDGVQEWSSHTNDSMPDVLVRNTWPIKITGQEIGKCQDVTDLAIDSGPAMTIWTFSKKGIAKVWKINDGRNVEPRVRLVVRDGTIRNVDADGDVEMLDATPWPESLDSDSSFPETFDGTSSFVDESIVFPSIKPRRERFEGRRGSVQIDSQGEVLMEDLEFLNSREEEISEGSFERASSFFEDQGIRGFVWREVGSCRDLVEELTGIARIDIEIR
jgi:hypothetical protein